ncbi:MAG: transcriptional regulator, partial [Phycisphaerales bacterium]
MMPVDRLIHEPVRLKIMMVLSGVAWADFPSLCRMLDLTRGNLSAHISRLERRKYIRVKKTIIGKVPHTQYQLTKAGHRALERYWVVMDEI